MPILTQEFFARPTLTVARDLLGQRLVRDLDGQRLSGLIVETEAYIGPDDTASHARMGRTDRNAIMFGPAGVAYVYFIYGMYHMLNIVTDQPDFPAAILIRALEPLTGQTAMQAHRQKNNRPLKPINLTNGPGKLCQALAIDRRLNHFPITQGHTLWLEPGDPLPDQAIAAGPRVGIDYATPECVAAPWRFWIKGNRFVSKR
ncbi:MAG: DNA-3-methyladenine glycosylase [Anaerolineales bacterium]|nr:DNA-3-methyladenine glycosylase [Anaerolineales bacterium]